MKTKSQFLFLLITVLVLCGLNRPASAMLTPQLGRFLQQDPLGNVDGSNSYQDERSNPTRRTDPLGLVSHMTMSEDDYWNEWVKQHPGLTPAQYAQAKAALDRGCIGVTALALGYNGNPDTSHCYSTLEKANAVQVQWVKDKCDRKSDACKGTARVFSIHFFDNKNAYKADSSGRVDMTPWNYKSAGPGWFNFDYALRDGGAWWHANHLAPGMEVYRDDISTWSREGHSLTAASGDYYVGNTDFNHQVFCVACAEKWK
jgi:hypothetical protein